MIAQAVTEARHELLIRELLERAALREMCLRALTADSGQGAMFGRGEASAPVSDETAAGSVARLATAAARDVKCCGRRWRPVAGPTADSNGDRTHRPNVGPRRSWSCGSECCPGPGGHGRVTRRPAA
jgi:hypothetical protein